MKWAVVVPVGSFAWSTSRGFCQNSASGQNSIRLVKTRRSIHVLSALPVHVRIQTKTPNLAWLSYILLRQHCSDDRDHLRLIYDLAQYGYSNTDCGDARPCDQQSNELPSCRTGACLWSSVKIYALHYRANVLRNVGLHVYLGVHSASNRAGFHLDLSLCRDIANDH